MSDTNISDYYPKKEEPPTTPLPGFEPPASLSAGEAPEPVEPAAPEALAPVEALGVDDLGIDLPDIPLPDDEPIEDAIKDTFEDTAFNFAIVGVGQGGSRLAESFWNLGY